MMSRETYNHDHPRRESPMGHSMVLYHPHYHFMNGVNDLQDSPCSEKKKKTKTFLNILY